MDNEDPLVLKSIDSKSLLVQTTLFPAHTSPVTVKALVDSGCSARGFADQSLIHTNRIPTIRLPKPRLVLLADGKSTGTITDYVVLNIKIGEHAEACLLHHTTLGRTSYYLGTTLAPTSQSHD